MPATTFIAYMDNDTGVFHDSYGKLTWIEKESKSTLRFQPKGMEMYRVKVRKNKENERLFFLVDVVGKVQESRLDVVKEKYQRPVVLTTELGEFTLDRRMNRFRGMVDYFGERCAVYLEIKEGESDADLQLDVAKRIFSNLQEWDAKVKEYACDKLLDIVDEWNEEAITKETFMQRIGMPDITVERGGSVMFMFETGDMCSDHAIEVVIDESGNWVSADIVG